jgi:hypothetical protein
MHQRGKGFQGRQDIDISRLLLALSSIEDGKWYIIIGRQYAATERLVCPLATRSKTRSQGLEKLFCLLQGSTVCNGEEVVSREGIAFPQIFNVLRRARDYLRECRSSRMSQAPRQIGWKNLYRSGLELP